MLYYLFNWLKLSGRDKDVLKYGTQNSVAVIVDLNREETSDKLKQKVISKQSVIYDVLVDEKTPAFFAVPTSERILSGESFIGSYYNGTKMFVTYDFAKKNVADLKKKCLIALIVLLLGASLRVAITNFLSDKDSDINDYSSSNHYGNSGIADKKELSVFDSEWKTVNIQGISYSVPDGFTDAYPDDFIMDSYQQGDNGISIILVPADNISVQKAYEILTDTDELKSKEIISKDYVNGMEQLYYSATNVSQDKQIEIKTLGRIYSVPGGVCVVTYAAATPNDFDGLEKIATSITSDGTPITVPPGY